MSSLLEPIRVPPAKTLPAKIPPTEMDSAWKNILDTYLEEFMFFYYPALAEMIDWETPYITMDKELQAITNDAMLGKQFVDKLIKVKSKQENAPYVLLHIEIQGRKQNIFPLRSYRYHYRVYDRYHLPVISLVILVDDNKNWRPTYYNGVVWGLEIIRFNFVMTKLLDYAKNRTLLEQTKNPFGIVTRAQLAALETRKNVEARFNIKFTLTRLLYDKGLKRDDVLNLYRFIDWVLSLPEDLEVRYNEGIKKLEEERRVDYITTAERIGMKKGYEEGISQGMAQGISQGMAQGISQGIAQGTVQGEHKLLMRQLKQKFPEISEIYLQRIEQEQNEHKLCLWGDKLITATTVAEVFEE